MSLEYLRPEVARLKEVLESFVHEQCQPAEREFEEHMKPRHGADRWTLDAIPPCMERLKKEAKRLGLWNMFLPHKLPPQFAHLGPQIYLSNREYGILCEVTGRSFLAPEACNCNAPDTGNMEVLLKHGTPQQQAKYLVPLLRGEIRSAFLMTEPDVASSDATNMETKLTKVMVPSSRGSGGGGKTKYKYILSGRKWWSTGAMHPKCRVALVLARMDYSQLPENMETASAHGAHTVVIVPMNKVTPVRPLTVFGDDDAPTGHAEVLLDNIELHDVEEALILGEGRGFEIAQSRLGPGRIHHCMRAVGMAARCYELMLERSLVRETFGQYIWEHGGCQELIADSFSDLEAARLLTLNCAAAMDEHGVRKARGQIASIKVSVPQLTHRIVDRAIQIFGGAGVSDDFPMARILTGLRSLRIADGPDAVHRRTVARLEIRKTEKRLEARSKL